MKVRHFTILEIVHDDEGYGLLWTSALHSTILYTRPIQIIIPLVLNQAIELLRIVKNSMGNLNCEVVVGVVSNEKIK